MDRIAKEITREIEEKLDGHVDGISIERFEQGVWLFYMFPSSVENHTNQEEWLTKRVREEKMYLHVNENLIDLNRKQSRKIFRGSTREREREGFT